MSNFLRAEAAWLTQEDPIEPTIKDVSGDTYMCERDECNNPAVAELQWPMEDHDLTCGFFCQECLDKILDEEVSE